MEDYHHLLTQKFGSLALGLSLRGEPKRAGPSSIADFPLSQHSIIVLTRQWKKEAKKACS